MTNETYRTQSTAFHWVYEKDDLDQGVYSISDSKDNKLAVILASDRNRPIEVGFNAFLMLRSHGSEKWNNAGTHDFGGALGLGSEHSQQYKQQSLEKEHGQTRQDELERNSGGDSRTMGMYPTKNVGRER